MTNPTRITLMPCLLVAAILAFLPLNAAAQNSCQTGQSSIGEPTDHYTIPTTYTVVASASTGGGCDITALRLYVDNKGVYTTYVNAPSAGFSKSITFAQGYHNLVVVAWNNDGYAFTSPPTTIFAAPTDKTVYITSPTANQTVNTTVTVAARARWDNIFVTHMRAYVDNVDVYDADNPQYAAISFQKVFLAGTHHLVVIAWDGAGSYLEASEDFTVK